jgi:hypothetical protein
MAKKELLHPLSPQNLRPINPTLSQLVTFPIPPNPETQRPDLAVRIPAGLTEFVNRVSVDWATPRRFRVNYGDFDQTTAALPKLA